MSLDPAMMLKTVLEASWQGSLVIVIILLLRPLLGVRMPARWRYLLWSLALLRLLLPAVVLPRSPASMQNLAVVDRPWEQARLAFPAAAGGGAVRDQGPDEADDGALVGPPSSRPAWWRVAGAVWIFGATAASVWLLAAIMNLHRRLRSDTAPVDAEVQRAWARCCERLAMQRPPRLMATSLVDSPALVGFSRPTLLIPRRPRLAFSPEDWEHVFLHELAHFRRRDHWTQGLQLLALCAHWFNPLVWLGFRYLRADRELAADEWALRHLDGERSVAYGDTLLKVLQPEPRGARAACLVGLMEDGAQLKQRLQHIVAFAPRGLAGSLAGLGLALALAVVVLGRPALDLAAYEGLAPAEILVAAARSGDMPVVEEMLARGVDVNAGGERTALMAAIASRQLALVKLLVSRGANIDLQPVKSDAPLVLAWKRGWPEGAAFLLGQGATPEPALLAAARGDAPALAPLLSSGSADFEKLKTLCEIAAAQGHAALFTTLYDAIRALPGHGEWEAGYGLAAVAIAREHRAVVEAMLERGEQLNRHGVMRLAPVVAQAPAMRPWLEAKGFIIPPYNDGERFIEAAEREDLREMHRLLAAGTDLNYRGESDWTPLSKAATWGNLRAVRWLLEKRAAPNPRKHSYSTLSLAKTPEIAELLIAHGALVKPADIEYPVGTGSLEKTRWFLDHGVDPQAMPDGGTAWLLEASRPELVRLLAKRGAAIRGTPAKLTSLIPEAWTPGAIELLLAAGADVNGRDRQGFTPLIQVLMRGWPAPARLIATLLAHGADADSYMPGNRTALMLARDEATIDALVAAGANLYAVSDQGQLVVHSHDESTRLRRAAALAKYGVHDDALMETYRRAGGRVGRLSFAAGQGDLAQMQALLAADAEVDARSEHGFTPLRFALECGQAAAARWLLEHGANVNRFDEYGLSVANAARVGGHFPIKGLSEKDSEAAHAALTKLLREQKPDPDFRNEAGETALMRAAASRSFSFEAALSTDRDLDAQRPDGMTALMLAVTSLPPKDGSVASATVEEPGRGKVTYSLQAYIVRTLLASGADRTQRNRAGHTALALARLSGNAEVLGLLELHP